MDPSVSLGHQHEPRVPNALIVRVCVCVSSPRKQRRPSKSAREAAERSRLTRMVALDAWMKDQATLSQTPAQKKGSTSVRLELDKLYENLWRPTLIDHLHILHRWLKKQGTLQSAAPKLPNAGSDSFLQAMKIFDYWQTHEFLPSEMNRQAVVQFLKGEIDAEDVMALTPEGPLVQENEPD